MKRTLFAIGLALVLCASAQAKTPKEVLEPYKAYRTALAADQRDEAVEHAYDAWQKAEDLMGDDQTTGDLAINFAELRPQYLKNKPAWKSVMKAHKRAIDLASLYPENSGEIEIDRRVKYLSWRIPTISPKMAGARDKKYSAQRLTERIQELGLSGSTFEAESYALQAQDNLIGEKWEPALEAAKQSIELFDTRTDGLFSAYEYSVPIYMARAYAEENQPIDAALTYQALMDKLEIEGGHDNAISAEAYRHWLDLRDEVARMKSVDPRASEVIRYKVPDSRQSELSPLVRIPPKVPSKFLRGNKSGWVRVKFSVDEEGRVKDVTATDYSKELLVEPSIESVKAWRYSPNADPSKRENLETTIRFNIQNRVGTRLPDGKPLPEWD